MPRIVETPMWAKQRELAALVLDPNPTYTQIATGGSRGGGKSTSVGRCHVLAALAYPRLHSVIIRRGTEEIINNYKDQIQEFTRELGVQNAFKYLEQKHFFRCLNGSKISLSFISEEKDYRKHIGQEYGLISLTEGQEHEKKRWTDMGGSNRAGLSDYTPRMTVDFNPGGIGQEWLTEMFVNPQTRPAHCKWIPTWIWDCPSTMLKNPNYISKNLMDLPDWQMKQWLWGRFDVMAGKYFVIPPWLIKTSIKQGLVANEDPSKIDIPRWADWSAGVDYGDTSPFAVEYNAKWQDLWTGKEHIHTVREIYEANLDLDQQAYRVRDKETELRDLGFLHDNRVDYYADPSVARKTPGESEDQSRSIASTWKKYGFYVRAARTNERIYGWKLMKMLLRHGVWTIDGDCKALLSEMGTAVANGSPGPPVDEDIKQGLNVKDHALDGQRYDLVSVFPRGYSEPELDPISQMPFVDRDLPRVPEAVR